jgi:iron complex transport system ATP-binding protein
MLTIDRLSLSYGSREILQDVTLDLAAGQLTSILGVNGSGKSTLLKAMAGLLKPVAGTIRVDNCNLAAMSRDEIARKIGYMPQASNGIASTVFDTVLLGRKPHIVWRASEHDLQVVRDILIQLELADYALRSTTELSGGELQKVIIARALAQEPRILLLDEPISHLDVRNQLETMALLQRIARQLGLVVVVVIHDLSMAIRFSDRFAMLRQGTIHASGGREVITPETIHAVFHIEAAIHEIGGVPIVVPFPHHHDLHGRELHSHEGLPGRHDEAVIKKPMISPGGKGL